MASPVRTIDHDHRASAARTSAIARTLNIALGVWLFISAFLWPHSRSQFLDTWICGVALVAFAILALGIPGARWINTCLGLWIFLSAFSLGHISMATVWNNALVGIAVFVLSLVPGAVPGRYDRPHTPRPA